MVNDASPSDGSKAGDEERLTRWSTRAGAWDGRRLPKRCREGRRIAFAAHLLQNAQMVASRDEESATYL